MELLLRIAVFTATLTLAGVVLWFSFTLIAILFVIGFMAACWFWLRAYLVDKDILNPTPGVPMESSAHHTVIEVDYEEIKK